jgi:hypothetical protein
MEGPTPDRNPSPVRPSLPFWKRTVFDLMPLRRREVNAFMQRIERENDFRLFCIFGKPGPLPVAGCHHPVMLDGQVYNADLVRATYLDPYCPDANPHHTRSLLADALLLRASRQPITDRNLRDMAPMLAQAAPEPFELVDTDPAGVLVQVASELSDSGLLERSQRAFGAAYALTAAGRLRLEEHVRGKWMPALN